jgi:trans-2,3-dihydro-3-hydroxyanthranilate isomerase
VRYPFRLVDVFSERPLAGNQLAVVLDAEGLGDERMLAIAREFNFSETTFVTPSTATGCDWRVRIFTPGRELPMAGHPTIGTAVVLEALGKARERTVFELGVGPTPVRLRPGWAEMDQRPPTFGAEHPDPAALAAALSVEPDDILGTGLPPQAVGTGFTHLMVPLRSLDAVGRLRPRLDLWEAAMATFPGLAAYCFARGGALPGSDVHCRMFTPEVEDPGTGSAAGPLASYLATRQPTGDGTRSYRVEQGFEMGRRCLLEASVDVSGGQVTAVRVGGSARIVAEGWLDLPD